MITADGAIKGLRATSREGQEILYPFHIDNPWSTHLEVSGRDGQLRPVSLNPSGTTPLTFIANLIPGVEVQVAYIIDPGHIKAVIKVTNHSDTSKEIPWLRFVTGIDCRMERYPQWKDKLFPTSLRYETTHFWALLGSPKRNYLAILSPQRMDSFKLYYNSEGGHRIHTIALDLINDIEPRPGRFLPAVPLLEAKEHRLWEIYFTPLLSDAELPVAVIKFCKAPFVEWKRASGFPGEKLDLKVYAPMNNQIDIQLTGGIGETLPARISIPEICGEIQKQSGPVAGLELVKSDKILEYQVAHLLLTLPEGRPGIPYPVVVRAVDKEVTASAYILQPWDLYVHIASAAASKMYPPCATHVCEAAMPVFSMILAEKLSPSASRRASIGAFLQDELFRISFTPEGKPLLRPDRIQNQSCAMDICRNFFLATGEKKWLDMAIQVARQFMSSQGPDGGFYTPRGTHYTAVYYPAKSLLDLVRELRRQTETKYVTLSKEIEKVVRIAVEDLYRRGENIETEGEQTYEDGMISCSALQQAAYSLFTGDNRFALRALELMAEHRCLEWRSPEAHIQGGSCRFWESYWAIGWGNCMNTPHGWTTWTSFAHLYIYLATGELSHLFRAWDSAIATLQIIDAQTGTLRFCFTPDPTIRPEWGKGPPQAGEQYLRCVPLSSDRLLEGGGEVHEIIKFLGETFIQDCYLFFSDNKWNALNAEISVSGQRVVVSPRTFLPGHIYINRGNIPQETMRIITKPECQSHVVLHGDGLLKDMGIPGSKGVQL